LLFNNITIDRCGHLAIARLTGILVGQEIEIVVLARRNPALINLGVE
jgi:hypothetical protein